MALEKKKILRKVEFIMTDEMVNPVCHCEYRICVLEDGNEIASTIHRENHDVEEMRNFLSRIEILKREDENDLV